MYMYIYTHKYTYIDPTLGTASFVKRPNDRSVKSCPGVRSRFLRQNARISHQSVAKSCSCLSRVPFEHHDINTDAMKSEIIPLKYQSCKAQDMMLSIRKPLIREYGELNVPDLT